MQLFHGGKAKSLKAAWEMVKGRGGGGIHHSSGGSKKASSSKRSSGERIGAAYLNAQLGQRLASPLIDPAIRIAKGYRPTSAQLISQTKTRLTSGGDYAKNVAIAVGDRWLDKKTGQANALSRGSVTAWAPEVYDGLKVIDDVRAKKSAVDIHAAYTQRNTGYDPRGPDFAITNDFVTKRILKHGGQAVRFVANRTKIGQTITRPLKKVLSAAGATT